MPIFTGTLPSVNQPLKRAIASSTKPGLSGSNGGAALEILTGGDARSGTARTGDGVKRTASSTGAAATVGGAAGMGGAFDGSITDLGATTGDGTATRCAINSSSCWRVFFRSRLTLDNRAHIRPSIAPSASPKKIWPPLAIKPNNDSPATAQTIYMTSPWITHRPIAPEL